MKLSPRVLIASLSLVALSSVAQAQAGRGSPPSAADKAPATKAQIDSAIKTENGKPARPLSSSSSSMEMCSGSPMPAGWLRTGGRWDPTSCGKPSYIIENVWTITKYAGMKVGATLDICSGQPTPTGWVIQDGHWDPTSCGRPSYIIDNRVIIRRVQ